MAGRRHDASRRRGAGWAIFGAAQRSEAAPSPDSNFPDPAAARGAAERKAKFEAEGSQFVVGCCLPFLWLPPVEDAARSESGLSKGRAPAGGNPWDRMRGVIARTAHGLARRADFRPECRGLADAPPLPSRPPPLSPPRPRGRGPEVPLPLDARRPAAAACGAGGGPPGRRPG